MAGVFKTPAALLAEADAVFADGQAKKAVNMPRVRQLIEDLLVSTTPALSPMTAATDRPFNQDSIWNSTVPSDATFAALPEATAAKVLWLDTWNSPINGRPSYSTPVYKATTGDPVVGIWYSPENYNWVNVSGFDRWGNTTPHETSITGFASFSNSFGYDTIANPGMNEYCSTVTDVSRTAWVAPDDFNRHRDAQTLPRTIYCPASAKPASGADGNMVVIQPDGTVYEFYNVIILNDGRITCWEYSVIDGRGYGDGWDNGPTASMIPYLAGRITQRDVDAGVINHAIACTLDPDSLSPATPVYPAYTMDRDATWVPALETLDAAKKASGITLSSDLLTATHGSTAQNDVVLALLQFFYYGATTYVEFTINGPFSNGGIGGGNASTGLNNTYLGADTNSFGIAPNTGNVFVGNAVIGAAGLTYGPGDTIGLAYNQTLNKIWARKCNGNGLWGGAAIGSQDPTLNVGGVTLTGLTGTQYPGVNLFDAYASVTVNFGNTPFMLAPPRNYRPIGSTVASYTGAIPMGSRLAIPAATDFSGHTWESDIGLIVATALKTYGAIVMDRDGPGGCILGVEANVATASFTTISTARQNDLNYIYRNLLRRVTTPYPNPRKAASNAPARAENLGGSLPVSRLNSGTSAKKGNVWRGDGSWGYAAGKPPKVLPYAASLAWNVSASDQEVATVRLTGNVTITVSGGEDGYLYRLQVVQDSVGSRTVTLSGVTLLGSATWATAANGVNILTVQVFGGTRYATVS